MSKTDMSLWGFGDRHLAESNMYTDYYVGRVVSQYKGLYKTVSENGELLSEVSGKFSFNTTTLSGYPAVGDFVMLDHNAIIHHVLQRKSAFGRKAAGTSNDEQIIASNIDTIFICMSLNNDYNLRRLERYLSIAWDSGAAPVVVLTKSDLCDDIDNILTEVQSAVFGADIVVASSLSLDGYSEVQKLIKKGQTIAFVGSSGVGKSTLINRLIGEDVIETNGLRNDDKGRHTTSRRELFMLKNGGMVIDTPGMREIGMECADLSKSFSDVDELSTLCKFSDCTHTNEPGCAIRAAIKTGTLSEKRFESYQKLQREVSYDGLSFRQLENEKINRMFGSKKNMKQMMDHFKNGGLRR